MTGPGPPPAGKSQFNFLKKRENPGGEKFIFMDFLAGRRTAAGGRVPLMSRKTGLGPRSATRRGAHSVRRPRPAAGLALFLLVPWQIVYKEDKQMNYTKRFVMLALSLLLCAGLLTAQQTNAKIFGVVQLEDGSLVPGVSVEATTTRLRASVNIT